MPATKWNKLIFLLPITIELIYLTLSLTTTHPLITTIFALPALFIIPGAILLTTTKKRHRKQNH